MGGLTKGMLRLKTFSRLQFVPDEDLLQSFFTQEFQTRHRQEGARALSAYAQMAARRVLQGRDQAVALARLPLGQWPSDRCPEAQLWQSPARVIFWLNLLTASAASPALFHPGWLPGVSPAALPSCPWLPPWGPPARHGFFPWRSALRFPS